MNKVEGSFRDRSGYVFADGDDILRSINTVFQEQWSRATDSGFLAAAVAAGNLVPFREREPIPGSWKTLAVKKIPFISYPYEWCFSQLKDAALLTLELQEQALNKGLILKDASAYNIQFEGVRPIFIDHLSFDLHREGEVWAAYRQFCMHFLAPLAITAKSDVNFGVLSKLWVDGIPLRLAAKVLPLTSRIRLGLFWHLFLHARLEAKHGDTNKSAGKAKNITVSTSTLKGIADNLKSTVRGLRLSRAKTEWGDYYTDTNYSTEAENFKLSFVEKAAAASRGGRLAVDLGANTGRYSAAMAGQFSLVVAADIDPLAVERHYQSLRASGPKNILPLVIDLGNPSPSLGWACRERTSFAERCEADFVSALALIHHLSITGGIPLAMVAEYFAQLLRPGATLLLEFVPKEDSQVKRLLAVREDVFDDYTLEGMRDAFSRFFDMVETAPISGSLRTLHVMRRR